MSVRWCLIVVAALAGTGCSRVRLIRECRELSAVIDGGRREVETTTRPNTPAAYRAAGPLYRRVARQLRQVGGSRQLRPAVEEYSRSVETFAPNLATYAGALEASDPEQLSAARLELDRGARRERIAARRLEQACHGYD